MIYQGLFYNYADDKFGGRKAVDYFEDDDVKPEAASYNGESMVFKNKSFDSGRRSFGNKRSRQPFMENRGHESGGRMFGRSNADGEGYSRFSDDVELKVNSGDVGKIIGTSILYIVCIFLTYRSTL